jgi:protocatechuate 3,4-dioxygenase beta subunit
VTVRLDADRRTTAAADGTFEFDDVEVGHHRLSAFGDEGQTRGIGLQVYPDRSPVSLDLEPGATYVVTVLDEGNQPIVGAIVAPESRAVTTDAAGRAIVKGVWGVLRVSATGFVPGLTTGAELGEVGKHEVTVILQRGVEVTGRVTGASLPSDATVWVSHDAGRSGVEAALDSDGRWRLDAMTPGPCSISVARGMLVLLDRVAATCDGTQEIVVELPALATVEGVVVDGEDRVVPFATVALAYAPQVTADADGRFRISHVPRARLGLVAMLGMRVSPFVEVDARDGKASARLVVADGALRGRCVDLEGRPVANVQVRAHTRPGAEAFRNTDDVSDADGRFTLGPFPPGRIRIWIRRPRSPVQNMHLEDKDLEGRVGEDVTIVVAPEGSIRGTVTLDGEPVDSYAIALSTFGPGLSFAMVEPGAAGGTFVREQVPAGTFALAIFGPDFVTRELEDVRVEPGKTLDLGVIEVERGRTIAGQVLDDTGRAVAGARVVVGDRGIELAVDDRWTDDWERRKLGDAMAITGADGRFEIRGVGPQAKIIAAHPDVGRSEPILASDNEVSIELKRTGRLVGRVREVPAGEHTSVRARGPGEGYGNTQMADASGRFEFPALVPGRYEVFVDPYKLGEPDVVEVEIRAGQTTTIELDGPPLNAGSERP